MTTLADDLIPDELWVLVEPLLPAPPRPPYGGRHRAIPRSQLLRRDHLYGPHLDTVAAPASPTARLWLVGDLLAPPHRMGQRRRIRPRKVHADKAYASRVNRAYLRRRGIRPRIARRGIESSARFGRHRWKIERALSWLSCWRRLQVR